MHHLRLVIGCGLIAIAAVGCVNNDTTVYILNAEAPEMDTCTFSGTPGTSLGVGLLDLRGSGYLFAAVVKNGSILSTTDPNLHFAQIQGADVTLKAAYSTKSQAIAAALQAAGKDQTTEAVSGGIGAAQTGAIAFDIIHSDQVDIIRGADSDGESIIAHISLFGSIDGGTFRAQPFDFPVQFCTAGCLDNFLGACPQTPMNKGNACNRFQDLPIDCCGTPPNLVCPATPM